MSNLNFIRDLEQDIGLELIGADTLQDDFYEELGGAHADAITYTEKRFTRYSFHATGFVWHHPHGGIIRGNFPQPILVADNEVDEHGDSIGGYDRAGATCRAILAKLGPVAAIDDNLLHYAARA